jgi:hypothetical protein
MTMFTYCSNKNYFFIALAVMFTGLILLKFSCGNNYAGTPVIDGQSVITLKNIYSSFTKKNFTEAREYQWTPKTKTLTAIKANTFNNTEKATPLLEKYTLNVSGIKIK